MSQKAVHLEGMGVIGSVTAYRLREAGVPFTWSDGRVECNAYRASAGGVYPINTNVSHAAVHHNSCMAWITAANVRAFGPSTTELCDYLYNTVSAPFGQSWKPVAKRGSLNLAPIPVVSVNTRQLVDVARARFAAQEGPPEPDAKRFITHGFGPRLAAHGWGCTAVVEIANEERIRDGATDTRPLLSLFAARSMRLYVVPLPGTLFYVIGSTIRVAQQKPETLDAKAADLSQRYRGMMRRLAGLDAIVHDVRQGWRPLANDADAAPLRKVDGQTWAVRPAAGSGVAQAFDFAAAVVNEAKR